MDINDWEKELLGKCFVMKHDQNEERVFYFVKFDNTKNRATVHDFFGNRTFIAEWAVVFRTATPLDTKEPPVNLCDYSTGWYFAFCPVFLSAIREAKYRGVLYRFDNTVIERFVVCNASAKHKEYFGLIIGKWEAQREVQINEGIAKANAEWEALVAENQRKREAVKAAERTERAEREEREKAEQAEREAKEREAAFWASPEGQKVRAAQMMADIERQRAIDAAKIRIAEQERIAEIGRQIRDEERQSQADLIHQVKNL